MWSKTIRNMQISSIRYAYFWLFFRIYAHAPSIVVSDLQRLYAALIQQQVHFRHTADSFVNCHSNPHVPFIFGIQRRGFCNLKTPLRLTVVHLCTNTKSYHLIPNGIKLRKSHITENVVWDFFENKY